MENLTYKNENNQRKYLKVKTNPLELEKILQN